MNDPAPASLRLSVIVPFWNDCDHLCQLVSALVMLDEFHEVIMVDASPKPVASETVRAAGGMYLRASARCIAGITRTALPHLTIQSSPRSRSKNSAGVEASRSAWRVASRLSRRASEPTQTR